MNSSISAPLAALRRHCSKGVPIVEKLPPGDFRDSNGQQWVVLFGVQQDHLFEWKHKLNAACYSDLVDFAKAKTKRSKSPRKPHIVPRGCALTEFVCNWGRVHT